MVNDSHFLERIEIYIWWVKNCSKNILPNQIKNEVVPMLEKLKEIKKITGVNYSSLIFLHELSFFNYDISKVKEYEINKKNSLAYFFG